MEFYEVLEQMNPNQCNMAMTVLEGEYLGEKALFTDRKQVWVSEKSGFFQLHKQGIRELEDEETWRNLQGIVLIDGTKVFCELLGSEKKFVICGGMIDVLLEPVG